VKLIAVIKTGFIRGLHQAAGMTIVELENNRYDSLCCGFAASICNHND
jgi:Fe-S oxidoreductase